MTNRAFVLALATGLAATLAAPLPAQDRDAGRPYYEMIVTNAGTRSQGWTGTLYGADGAPVAAEPGSAVETPLGAFSITACTLLWEPCGAIPLALPPGEAAPTLDAMVDVEPWRFVLYIVAEGSRSEGWRGALWHGETELTTGDGSPVWTPFGTFRWLGDDGVMWHWSGWAPEGWPVL